jgi:HlyD family secretion protein
MIEQPTKNINVAQPLTKEDTAQAAMELQAFKTLETKSSRSKRARRLRILIIVVVVAFIALTAIIIATLVLNSQKNLDTLKTTQVSRGTFEETISGSGILKAVESITITPEIDGTVAELYVAEGDTVAAGQLLFTIDNPELDYQVSSAQRAVESAALGVSAAIVARDNAQKAADNAYSAYLQLFDSGNAARNAAAQAGQPFDEMAFEQQTSASWQQYDSLVMQITSAQQQITAANLQLADAQAMLDLAVTTAGKRSVYAPIAGQVVVQNLERGVRLSTLAGQGRPPMQIADLSSMFVALDINEIDILALKVGQEALVTFDALTDYEVGAFVDRISSTTTNAEGASLMGSAGMLVTYPVDLIIENPDSRLKIGFSCAADILVRRLDNTLIVDSLALRDRSGNKATVVVQDGENAFREVEVVIVASSDSEAAIEGAVKQGDTLVIPDASLELSGFMGLSIG